MNIENRWAAADAVDLYNIERWGLGYFGVDEDGYMVINAGMNGHKSVRLLDWWSTSRAPRGWARR